jgi:hypothetical protein
MLMAFNLELKPEFPRSVLGILFKSFSYFKGVLKEERLSDG